MLASVEGRGVYHAVQYSALNSMWSSGINYTYSNFRLTIEHYNAKHCEATSFSATSKAWQATE